MLQDILPSIYLYVLSVLGIALQRGCPHTLHNTSQCVQHSLRSEVFGGNQVNEMFLSSFLLSKKALAGAQMPNLEQSAVPGKRFKYLFKNLEDCRVGMLKVCR